MKTINLKPNGAGRYDDVSPFIITDNNLRLKVNLPALNGDFYLITEINDKTEKRLIAANGELCLDGLTAGELRAEVKHYLKGELIKTYHIEPLLLKEVDGSLSAEPEIKALWKEIAEIKKARADDQEATKEREESYKSKLEEYENKVKKLQPTVNALLLFAYTDYRKNVYLGGESVDGFCKEFGLELTEEEKKILEEVN